MSQDNSNPFKKLAEEFACRGCGKPGSAGVSAHKATPSLPVAERAEASQVESDDARIFLDAMRRIAPLQDKKNRRIGQTLGEALAAKMRESGDAALFAGYVGDKRLRSGGGKGGDPMSAGRKALTEKGVALTDIPPQEAAPAALSAFTHEGIFSNMLDSFDKERTAAEPDKEELSLFTKAMQGVAPVKTKGREVAAPSSGGGAISLSDPAKALRDVLEGRVEFALHHTDEYMEGFVKGVDPLVLARLRSGQYSPEAHVDLHGMNARQAFDSLVFFIKNAYQRGLRTVVVVTGRGKNSPDGIGVLREMLQRWLCREPFKRVILAFCTARPGDGGPGAAYVLLRKYKKSRGKIIWERVPSDDDFPDL